MFAMALTLGTEYSKVQCPLLTGMIKQKEKRDFFPSTERMKYLPKHFNSPHHVLTSHDIITYAVIS